MAYLFGAGGTNKIVTGTGIVLANTWDLECQEAGGEISPPVTSEPQTSEALSRPSQGEAPMNERAVVPAGTGR